MAAWPRFSLRPFGAPPSSEEGRWVNYSPSSGCCGAVASSELVSPRMKASTCGRSCGWTSTSRAFEPSDWPDHATRFEQVHESAGLGEADPELALQHRGGAELAGDHQFGGLQQHVHVVANLLVGLHAVFFSASSRHLFDVFAVLRLALGAHELHGLANLGFGHPRALHTNRLGGTHRQEQRIALTNQRLGTDRVKNDSRIGGGRGGERQSGWNVGLDQTGDHVHGRDAAVASTRCTPAARASWVMRWMELSTSFLATIIRSAISSTTTRMYG